MFDENFTVFQSGFRFFSNTGHSLNRFYRIFTSSSFTRQHDRISTVENSVSYVTCFSASRSRITLHGIKHLSCCDNWFTSNVTFFDHTFLSERNIFSWNFNTKVTTRHHQAIGNFKNFIEVIDTLLVFDFRNNLNVCSIVFFKQLTNFKNITSFTHEGSSNKIDA
ncbi:hypothetical protein D3C78_1099730 [compost metagenome]